MKELKNNRNIKIDESIYRKISKYAHENGYKLKALVDIAVDDYMIKKNKEKDQLELLNQ